MPEEAQTFEEARGDWREKRQEEGEEPAWSDASPIVPDEASVEEKVEELRTILAASPGKLARRRGSLPQDPHERLNPIRLRLGELDGILEGLRTELNQAETSQDFLSNIAQSNLFISSNLGVLASTQVEMLDSIFTIMQYLSPFDQMTVSGTNEIEDADTAEPVVPDSDDTSIPTKTLFVKSSAANNDTIALGDDSTDPENGWILYPNDHVVLNMDLRREVLWMASDTEDQVVELMGFI